MGKGGGGGSYVPNPTYKAKVANGVNGGGVAQAPSNTPSPAPASSIFNIPVNQYNHSQLAEALQNKQVMADRNNQWMLFSRNRDMRMRGPDASPLQGPAMMLTQPKSVQSAQPMQSHGATPEAMMPGAGYTNGLLPNAGANFPAGFVPIKPF